MMICLWFDTGGPARAAARRQGGSAAGQGGRRGPIRRRDGMRRAMGSLALAALGLLGGCASAPPPEAALHGQGVVARSPVVPCTTTWLVLATVSKCGSGGLQFGVGTE